MTARATKLPAPMPITNWYGHDQKPVHVGAYQVRNNPAVPAHNCQILDSSVRWCVRWWDGMHWLTKEGGMPSIIGARLVQLDEHKHIVDEELRIEYLMANEDRKSVV